MPHTYTDNIMEELSLNIVQYLYTNA